jgi:hypothetical protein
VRKLVSGLVVAYLLSISLVVTTLAQTPEKVREFVYGVNVYNGTEYHGTFYPPSEDTLYILADVTNIISPRNTLVYFWPATNELKADWDNLNEVVDGTLEIVQGGEVIDTLAQTKYVIQYPSGYDSNEVYVYTGEAAETQYQEFNRQKNAFRDEVAAYYEAEREYREQLFDDVTQGKLKEEPPPPPEQPAPFLFFSTGIHDGFALTLPAGTYTIRLRDNDGQIVADSERELVVFSPQREGVGYTVVPQDKWTIPDQSDDPSQILYARGGTVIYLQPFAEEEYNEQFFTRLETPQDATSSADRWMWVHLQPQDGQYLEVLHGDQVVDSVDKKAYVVKQLPGTALGYEILEQQQAGDERSRSRTPDFEGYEIEAGPDQPSMTIRLVDVDGKVIRGSEREIKLVDPQFSSMLFILPVIPLLVGGGMIFWRKKRFARLPKYGEFAGR